MTVVAVAVMAFVVSIPALASANPVDDLLHNLGLGGNSGSGSTGSTDSGGGTATPDAGSPPNYTPPLHGTNPHGQGTVGVVDITPSGDTPLSGDPTQTGEDVIAGDSRGEQSADGSYHGTITLAQVLGIPLLQVKSNPGETKEGPLDPVQTQLLNQICSASGNQVCLTLLQEHSATSSNGSQNKFEAAGVHLGGAAGINADVATSNGNISDDGTCQTAHGDSSVANANVGPISAAAINGTSDSQACNNGTSSTNQGGSVVNLKLGNQTIGVPIPTAGCPAGTPNQNLDVLGLVGTVCNADNQSGQATGPYGVREGLTVFLLSILDQNSLVKATTAGPESLAKAPGSGTTPTPPNNGGGTKGAGGKGGNNGGNGGGGNGGGAGGNGPAAGTSGPGNGQLAFTGADLLVLGLVGGALILGGLALTTTAGRRHRQTI